VHPVGSYSTEVRNNYKKTSDKTLCSPGKAHVIIASAVCTALEKHTSLLRQQFAQPWKSTRHYCVSNLHSPGKAHVIIASAVCTALEKHTSLLRQEFAS
jgi:hypothetical protein